MSHLHAGWAPKGRHLRDQGFVLIASLLLLVVLTVLALGMFRSFGLDGKIGSNVREKHRALQAAQSAEQYAEWWLASGNNAINTVINCTALVSANAGQGQVCTNQLSNVVANVATVPWVVNGAPVGVTYTPPGMNVTQVGALGTYFAMPTFYISQVGPAANGLGTIFRIDAVGYGGSPDAVAIVESTFEVGPGTQDLTQP